MPEDGALWKWLLSGVGAIGGALSVTVATLWRTYEARTVERIKELNDRIDSLEAAHIECEKRFRDLVIEVAKIQRGHQ